MIKQKVLTLLVLLMTAVTGAWAGVVTHWPDFNYNDYVGQGCLVAAIQIDGDIITSEHEGWDALEIAIFVGDECRGNNYYLYNGYVEEYGDPFPIIDGNPIFYNNPGEQVSFKMYDHINGILYEDCVVTLQGEPLTIHTGEDHDEGWWDPENPVILSFTTPESPAAPATYTVTLKEGTDDATSWQGKAGTGEYQALPLEGVAAGTAVTVKYNGTKKVKSVKAKKKVKPAATVTTAPTAKTGVKAGQNEAIVNAGTAEGGTMMYMVNASQPASTEGFSATVPTAEGLTAGTYYVWYYVKADDSHTDSEISATGIAVTIASAYTMAAAATSADKGNLICTDGHIHAYGADAACTKARVAKIIYIGTTGHATYSHGLALALTDEGQMNWTTAVTTCSGKNTSTPVTGATWLLASKDQWNSMLGDSGAGGYPWLRDFFNAVGGTNMQSAYYWSSTESSDNIAWKYLFNDEGYWSYGQKENVARVRACLAF